MNINGLPRQVAAFTIFGLLTIVCLHVCKPLAAQQPGPVLPGQDGDATNTTTKETRRKLPRKGDSKALDYLKMFLEKNDDLREKLARKAEKYGKAELVEWLRSKMPVEPAVVYDPLASATALADKKDWGAATDAYLAAYRTKPDLFKGDHIDVFQKAGRLLALAEFFDEAALKRMSIGNSSPLELAAALLQDAKTKPGGDDLLKRVLKVGRWNERLALKNPPSQKKDANDPLFRLRSRFIPEDFKKEGAGWWRVSVGVANYDLGTVKGPITNIKGLYRDREDLRRFADEIRVRLDENPTWEAGWALLAFFEAESGNYREAADVLSERFVDANADRIPSHAAWLLGVCLEGKDKELDQVVIKLLEPCLRKIATKNFTRPPGSYGPLGNDSLRVSPIKKLAGLYAKYDRRLEARQLLYGLVDSTDQHPLVRGYVPGNYTNIGCGNVRRCNACHRKERAYHDFIAMADVMTDIGYPVDSLLSLGRMDASFGNAFDSSRGWIDPRSYFGKDIEKLPGAHESLIEGFGEQKAKAETAVTPQLVIEALGRDTFQRSLRLDEDRFGALLELIKMIEGDDETTIALLELAGTLETGKKTDQVSALDLMLSVRGEGKDAKATVFSPVIDILKLAVNAQAPQVKKDIAELDQKLANLSETESGGIEAGIAATVFAFLRNDFEAADARMKKLQALHSAGAKEPQRSDLGLWLVARYALADDRTNALGEQFAERAMAAAEKQPDPLWKQAMLREQKTVMNQAVLRK